jgi:hypothetical protein
LSSQSAYSFADGIGAAFRTAVPKNSPVSAKAAPAREYARDSFSPSFSAAIQVRQSSKPRFVRFHIYFDFLPLGVCRV